MASIEERLKGQPDRLIILAACGFARAVEHLLIDRRYRDAITVAEQFADNLASKEEVRFAVAAITVFVFVPKGAENEAWAKMAAYAALATALAVFPSSTESAVTFVAKTVTAANKSANGEPEATQSLFDCILAPRIQHAFPAHVNGLASTIYEKRDWSLMPILADALEEMGLEAFAQHCRQPIHAKGCHVLDSILGRH